jgi:hypothetical protein
MVPPDFARIEAEKENQLLLVPPDFFPIRRLWHLFALLPNKQFICQQLCDATVLLVFYRLFLMRSTHYFFN